MVVAPQKPGVTAYVVGRQRLLEPADVGGLVKPRATDRLIHREGLISVVKISKVDPTAARTIFKRPTSSLAGPPILIFEPPKPSALACGASSTNASAGRCSQPPPHPPLRPVRWRGSSPQHRARAIC